MQTGKKYFLSILFIVFLANYSYSQSHSIDSLRNVLKTQQDDTNKVNTLNALSDNLWRMGRYGPALISATTAQELAEKLDYTKGIATALQNRGIIYSYQGNYPQALDYYFKALTLNKKTGNKKGIASNLGNIGIIYDEEANYNKAMEYYDQTLALYQEIDYKKGIATVTSTIGVIYEEQKNYQKALQYYQRALTMNQELGNNDGSARDLGNIGVIYYDDKELPKSLEYSYRALSLYRAIENKNGMAINLGNIGSCYLLQKNYTQAQAYLDSALSLSKEIRQMEVTRDVYGSFFILDSATGDYQKAFEDHKKYLIYRDSLSNRESVKKITQIEIQYEFEKKEEANKAEQEKKNIITYSALAILSLLFILAILFINRQQIRRKRDKLLFEKEKEQMENELKNAQIMLDEYLKSMVEKNELLEQFKTDVENLKILKAREIDENRIENLENLNKATILTEEDWNKFKKLFEQAHKGFFIRLKEKLPDLTQAEIRLVCLSKLKIDTKQMAGILGVSTDAIKKARYRLRKKLGLSGEYNIEEIDISI